MRHDYIKQFNLVDQYVSGKLTAAEAEEFEDHFIDCAECVEQLDIARSFIEDLKRFAVEEALVANKPDLAPRPWHLQRLGGIPAWTAASICVLLMVAGILAFFTFRRIGQIRAELIQTKEETATLRQQYQQGLEAASQSEKQYLQTRQQLDELAQKLKLQNGTDQPPVLTPESNFPIFALISVRAGSSPVEVRLPASSSGFALSIPVEDSRNFSMYRIAIVNDRGKVVWQRADFKPDAYQALSLSLRSNFLTPGNYDLKVDGLQGHQWAIVGNYPFRFSLTR